MKNSAKAPYIIHVPLASAFRDGGVEVLKELNAAQAELGAEPVEGWTHTWKLPVDGSFRDAWHLLTKKQIQENWAICFLWPFRDFDESDMALADGKEDSLGGSDLEPDANDEQVEKSTQSLPSNARKSAGSGGRPSPGYFHAVCRPKTSELAACVKRAERDYGGCEIEEFINRIEESLEPRKS